MIITVDDSESLPYIRVSLYYKITDDDLQQFQEALFSSKGFKSKDQLIDYSGVVHYEITPQGLEAYSKQLAEALESSRPRLDRKIAIIAPKDLPFGMSRVFAAHMQRLPSSYRVFRNEEEAFTWLAVGANTAICDSQ